MTKLKRVLESAEERGVAPEIVGVERYGVCLFAIAYLYPAK